MSPAPPYALSCWADDRSFYVQVPGALEPVTITYPITNMSGALPLLRKHFRDTPRPVSVPAKPVSHHSNAAQAVLRRMGMIG